MRRSATGVERWMKSLANCTVYQGHTRFAGDHRVRVGAEVLEAQRIFINVGARAFVPMVCAGSRGANSGTSRSR